jgi:hypothetical protein
MPEPQSPSLQQYFAHMPWKQLSPGVHAVFWSSHVPQVATVFGGGGG